MKQRRRYIAFELADGMNKADLLQTVNLSWISRPKADRALIKLVLYDASSRRGLLRCGHRQVDEVKAAMEGAGQAGPKRVISKIFGVSGTIKAAKRKFLAPQQAKS